MHLLNSKTNTHTQAGAKGLSASKAVEAAHPATPKTTTHTTHTEALAITKDTTVLMTHVRHVLPSDNTNASKAIEPEMIPHQPHPNHPSPPAQPSANPSSTP